MPTYTCYPTPGSSGVAVDGYASRTGTGESWSSLRSGAGTSHSDSSSSAEAGFYSSAVTSNQWNGLHRAILLFDTSAIPAGATILSATVSLYGLSKTNSGEYTTKFDIYTSNPSSNSSIHSGDYGTLGTTSQTTGGINLAALSTSGYNDWPLSATGISNIVPGGITKFGLRERTFDAGGSTPTWTSPADFEFYFYPADNGSRQPKLVVVTGDTIFTDTPSDGIVLGGSVSQARSSANAPTSGVVLAGSTVQSVAKTANVSGGIVLGGSAVSTTNVTLTVRLLSAGVVIGSWTHSLSGNQARVAWVQFGVPRSGDFTPYGGIVLGGSSASQLSRTLNGDRALVSVVGNPGQAGSGAFVTGARALVSVVGKAGTFPANAVIVGARAIVLVHADPWDCHVRFFDPVDSADLDLDPVDSDGFSLDPVPSSETELVLSPSSCR